MVLIKSKHLKTISQLDKVKQIIRLLTMAARQSCVCKVTEQEKEGLRPMYRSLEERANIFMQKTDTDAIKNQYRGASMIQRKIFARWNKEGENCTTLLGKNGHLKGLQELREQLIKLFAEFGWCDEEKDDEDLDEDDDDDEQTDEEMSQSDKEEAERAGMSEVIDRVKGHWVSEQISKTHKKMKKIKFGNYSHSLDG